MPSPAPSATLVVLLAPLNPPSAADVTCFTHFEIPVLPGTEGGPAGPAVGDFDGEGDRDAFAGEREDRWRDAVLVDVDGDGDLDPVSKVWNTGDRAYHADLWRNDNPQCGPSGEGSRSADRGRE